MVTVDTSALENARMLLCATIRAGKSNTGSTTRPSQLQNLSKNGQYAARKAEHRSSVRAKVEHGLGVAKGLLQYRKDRYQGQPKQTAKLNLMFALANMILTDRPCLTVGFVNQYNQKKFILRCPPFSTGGTVPFIAVERYSGKHYTWNCRQSQSTRWKNHK